MEINESNPKPKTTGGLKIMTIFIVVLAAHVLAIGGVTTYYMLKGSSDPDLVSDKGTPKTVKVAADGATISDSQTLPGADSDKSDTMAAATEPSTADTNSYTVPAAPSDVVSASATPDNASAPSSEPMMVSPPTATPSIEPTASTPSAPIQSGPVITPPPATTPGSAPVSETASEPAAANALAQEPTEGTPYTVKSHDSLARIAHRHHMTLAKLKAANSLKSDMLQIGQKLTIPAPAMAPEATSSLASVRDTSTPLLGDTGDTTAPTIAPAATPATTVAAAKPAAKPVHEHASLAATTSGSHHTYTVIKGDTLTKIARKFKTTTGAIMAANDSVDARKLRIGQKLRIPAQESRSANITPAPAQPEQVQPEPIEPRAAPRAQLANFQP